MKFTIERAVSLADLDVKGRTVTAYAAAFDSPASVYDPQFSPARHLESVSRLREMAAKIKGSRHGDLWRQFQLLVGALSGDAAFATTLTRYSNAAWTVVRGGVVLLRRGQAPRVVAEVDRGRSLLRPGPRR